MFNKNDKHQRAERFFRNGGCLAGVPGVKVFLISLFVGSNALKSSCVTKGGVATTSRLETMASMLSRVQQIR